MTPITSDELLKEIKNALGITGDHLNSTLNIYINEVKEFMLDGGVNQKIVDSTSAIGAIARGVSDLWNYGAGDAQLSTYFIQRVSQLALKEVDEDVIDQ